jgi:hypothetical protein
MQIYYTTTYTQQSILIIDHKLHTSYKYDILIIYSQIVTVCLLQIMINKNQPSTHNKINLG